MKRGPESGRTLKLVNLLRKKAAENKARVWKKVADRLSASARRRSEVNLYTIDKHSKEGDIVVVPGKVLANGSLSHGVTVAAHSFSASAAEKIRKSGGSCVPIEKVVESNPEGRKIVLME